MRSITVFSRQQVFSRRRLFIYCFCLYVCLYVCLCICFLTPIPGYAFPDNVRYGYSNCTSCHYSPNGGGLLTDYGRELSREILSTWGKEGNEVRPLYGIIPTPSWISLGGDLRAVQIYRDNPLLREAIFIPMQIDPEVAIVSKKIIAVATSGIIRKRTRKDVDYKWGSRRHYLLINILPTITFRVGKFLPSFGLNLPDHIIATKRALSFDQGSETYNAEISYLSQNINVYMTRIFGRKKTLSLGSERGGAISSSYTLNNRYKVGGSYFYGDNGRSFRNIIGAFAILGFTEKLYLLSELDYQRQKFQGHPNTNTNANAGTHQWGRFCYLKFGVEIFKGFHGLFSYDQSYHDLQDSLTVTSSFGPGILWYPRPHYELSLTWLKQKNPSLSNDLNDLAILMLHYYL